MLKLACPRQERRLEKWAGKKQRGARVAPLTILRQSPLSERVKVVLATHLHNKNNDNLLFTLPCLVYKSISKAQFRSISPSSLRDRRKKGRGREKSSKEETGKGAPAIRAGVFVIRPPFFCPFPSLPYPLPISTPATQANHRPDRVIRL